VSGEQGRTGEQDEASGNSEAGEHGKAGDGAATRLERLGRMLLRCYPPAYRHGRGEEILGTLLEATRLLRDRGIKVRALIVGDGPERPALQRQAADLGLGEAAIFTGRVPAAKVREFHALLDVFVVPRTPDRVCQLVTPLKPVEAMASGLCVVTSEVKALAEIIKPDVTGALTIPQDPVSLADRLEFLFYSPDIRKKLGDSAREWVARDRTWAHHAARYKDAYARLGAT